MTKSGAQTKNDKNAQQKMMTVKDLSKKFGIDQFEIRKALRKLGFSPKIVPVEEGWPGQLRKQYVWKATDLEFKRVLTAFRKYLDNKREKENDDEDDED